MKILRNRNRASHTRGFSLIEVLIACAIIASLSLGLFTASQKAIQLSDQSLKLAEANMLLEEGAEAIKTIRDANWTNISSLTLETNYYLSYSTSTNTWSLGTTVPAAIDGVFTRKMVFSAVNRDINDDIVSSGGTLDTRTKKVTISVSYGESYATITKTLIFYIADIFN
jgi:prepilin-type N-terminal cleavage/methylation domain-containing protein